MIVRCRHHSDAVGVWCTSWSRRRDAGGSGSGRTSRKITGDPDKWNAAPMVLTSGHLNNRLISHTGDGHG